ncbi:MAG TPA: hypothetical protein PKY31_02970 [Spirochaetota bacterium]|nr:hypothetical protein [Spirochaetota bacterium]
MKKVANSPPAAITFLGWGGDYFFTFCGWRSYYKEEYSWRRNDMVAETTVTISRDMLVRLAGAAEYAALSKSGLISALLRRVARDKRLFDNDSIRVRYQDRREKEEWHCLHVSFRRDEFEFYRDLRVLCRFSVSFLITYAIEHYLYEVTEMIKNTDNYRYHNHSSYCFVDNGVVSWVRCWGVPTRIPPNHNARDASPYVSR